MGAERGKSNSFMKARDFLKYLKGWKRLELDDSTLRQPIFPCIMIH